MPNITERYRDKGARKEWKASLSCYRDIVALEFSTEEDNFKALERLCCPLLGLPYSAPTERTLIIPAEAEEEFAGLSYNRKEASWASDYKPNKSIK